MKTRRVWKTTVRATLALLQIYKQFCLYCKHINVETQKSNVAALGGSVAVTFRYCFACTMQVKMYAATAAALRSINGTSLRFFLGLQLNNITSLAIDLRLRARPVKKVTVTCFLRYNALKSDILVSWRTQLFDGRYLHWKWRLKHAFLIFRKFAGV